MTDLRSLIPAADRAWMTAIAAATPPGCFVEVGVYQGGSAQSLYDVADLQGRTLHLYDTFSGHPAASVTGHDKHQAGRYVDAITPDTARRQWPAAQVHEGIFPATLVDMGPVAFVHADADLYESTRAICRALFPRLVPGGVLYVDDYSDEDTPGCRAAVDEMFGPGVCLPNGRRIMIRGGL